MVRAVEDGSFLLNPEPGTRLRVATARFPIALADRQESKVPARPDSGVPAVVGRSTAVPKQRKMG